MSTFSFKELLHTSFNLSYLENERYKWVDYLRGIAILLVVYRHVLIGIERAGLYVPSGLVTANMIFYSFRMPLFFILSGMFIGSSLRKTSINQILYKKFEVILYPYFVWCFLQVTLQILLSSYTNATRTWIDYTYIFYHPRQLDQFWYLPALFNVTLLYILTKRFFKLSSLSQLLLGIILYYMSRTFNQVSIVSDCMEFYLFFAVGDVFSKFLLSDRLRYFLCKWYVVISIIPVFFVIQKYYISYPESYFLADFLGRTEFIFISLFGCFAMLMLAINIQNFSFLSFLRIIGVHSLYIYVMHVFVAAFVRVVLVKLFHVTDAGILLPAGIVLSIVVCIVFYNLVIKRGPLWFLFQFKKPSLARI